MKKETETKFVHLKGNCCPIDYISEIGTVKAKTLQFQITSDVFHYLLDVSDSYRKEEDKIALFYEAVEDQIPQTVVTIQFTFQGILILSIEADDIRYTYPKEAEDNFTFVFEK